MGLVAPWHVGLSSPPRDQGHISCIARWILNHWTTREVPFAHLLIGLFVFWMSYKSFPSFNLPFLLPSSIPLDLSLSPMCLCPSFWLSPPLSELSTVSLSPSFSFPTCIFPSPPWHLKLKIWPPFPFHLRKKSNTNPVISVLAGFPVPIRSKIPISPAEDLEK